VEPWAKEQYADIACSKKGSSKNMGKEEENGEHKVQTIV
jgi:hypothetical protein